MEIKLIVGEEILDAVQLVDFLLAAFHELRHEMEANEKKTEQKQQNQSSVAPVGSQNASYWYRFSFFCFFFVLFICFRTARSRFGGWRPTRRTPIRASDWSSAGWVQRVGRRSAPLIGRARLSFPAPGTLRHEGGNGGDNEAKQNKNRKEN